jgi:hypothetical protein
LVLIGATRINIYKITVSYLEPVSIPALVAADTPDDALAKFKEATSFETAPAHIQATIDSVELIEEDIGEVSDMEDYINNKKNRILN